MPPCCTSSASTRAVSRSPAASASTLISASPFVRSYEGILLVRQSERVVRATRRVAPLSAAGRDHQVLFAIDFVGSRRGVARRVHGVFPEDFSRALVEGAELAVAV